MPLGAGDIQTINSGPFGLGSLFGTSPDLPSSSAQSLMTRERELQQDFNQNSANQAMQFASDEAQKAREYNTFMSNTAIQRRMADLEAGGINPILAVQGSGAAAASSPSSPAPSGSSASANQGGVIDRLGQFIQSAGGLIRAFK